MSAHALNEYNTKFIIIAINLIHRDDKRLYM